MQLTPDNNSYESIIKKLQKIYQQRNENSDNIKQRTNDTIIPQQESNETVGAIQIDDTGDIPIKPNVSDSMIAKEQGTILPTDVNYTYTKDFQIPEKWLGFLGFENYFSVQAPTTISAGFIGQASAFTSNGYQIIADGTTVWNGINPPSNYLMTIKLSQCISSAKYYAPAWQIIMPGPNTDGPAPGTYNFLGFMITYDVTIATPNTLGTYYLYNQFWGMNVTNVDGSGNVTATGMLVSIPGKTSVESLETQIYGEYPVPPECTISAPNVPQYMTTTIWPQTWQNPNDLSVTIPGLTPIIPGQTVQFTGNQYNGDPIYQPPPNLEFITPGSLFIGVTFEATFPSIANFEAAGMSLSEATSAYSQLYAKWGNDLGGGTIANASNQPGNGWDVVRVPGDMGLSGISSDGQTIAFSVMWTAYLVGSNPSWFYLGNVSNYSHGSNVFPAPEVTYGVTMTFNMSEINTIFISLAGENPGNESMFPAKDPNVGFYPSMSSNFPAYTNWTFQTNDYHVFYDENFCCPLFLLNYPSNPNIGRPDQHESMNPVYSLAGGFDVSMFLNAGCFYYFPFRTIELKSNTEASDPLNVAVLDNTFDPFFIRKSKTTDENEVWTVSYYYSAILLAPAVFKETNTFLQVDDSTIFQYTVNSTGYIVNAQEGVSPWTTFSITPDHLFPDENGVPTVASGPTRYSVSTPNSFNHSEQTIDVYGPDPSDLVTRVKVSLKNPVNWLKLNKYDAQEL